MRRENGITLVALIITIIILVILAAVSVAAVYNMGIVNYAVNGTQEYAQAAVDENQMLDSTTALLDSTLIKLGEIINGSSIPDVTKNRWKETFEDEDGCLYYIFNIDGTYVASDTSSGTYVIDGQTLSRHDQYGDEGETVDYLFQNGKFTSILEENDSIININLTEINPGTTIKFTIGDTEYTAPEGITWTEWAESDDENVPIEINGGEVVLSDTMSSLLDNNGRRVSAERFIFARSYAIENK